ncbi:MAG: molybdopterin molybdotransferase MoeA [Spirochaetales bacterium]|nr:molybdopterin molybdotransferase MoeA [Spirochaetales bacterium]
MIHPDDALALIERLEPALSVETVPLAAALGRVLARSLASPVDQPPFDKSAMDGFAHRLPPGTEGEFRVVGSIAAGGLPAGPIGDGECARVMTGAPLPDGTVSVQRIEWTEECGPGLVRFTRPEKIDNVIRRGENVRAGDIIMTPRRLRAQDLGILAAAGYAELPVARSPRVGVVSTGDELASPGERLAPGAIYDSNGPQLVAMALAAGARASFYGRHPDSEAALERAAAKALAECDLVVLSGGVSMGDYDYVPAVMARLGVERLFHGVLMKPGKPTWFGRKGGRFVLGLPGNPVSTFVNFEFFGKALLARLQGVRYRPETLRLTLAIDLSRKTADRVEWFPCRREGTEVRTLPYSGSSMLQALENADCMVRLEIDEKLRPAGSQVDARLL